MDESSERAFKGSTLREYYCAALDMSEGTGLGTWHAVDRRERAVGNWDIDFADGAIDFTRSRGSFQTVGEQKSFEGDAGRPHTFQCRDIFGLQFVELAFGVEDPWTGREHLGVFFKHEGVNLPGAGKDFLPVFQGHQLCAGVLIDNGSGAFAQ